MSTKMNRRRFLFGSAMATAGLVLASCTKVPETAAPPTAAPAAPPTVPPTTAPTPRPSNTPLPTRPPATAVPTAVAAKEAPMWQELVAAGKLPPLSDRLPKNPVTHKPIHQIGKYGGTMRIFSPDLGYGALRMQYGHSPLWFVDDGLNIAPGMCDTWSANADNSEWTFHIREGLKWSDGHPCTVDDVLFVYHDMVLNDQQSERLIEFYVGGGKPVEMIKMDDYTLKLKYVTPQPLTFKRIAMRVKGGAGAGTRWIAPKHYLIQFHPTYNSAMKDFTEFDLKIRWDHNPECPHLCAWGCERYDIGQRRVWVRNPYFYCIDTEGNQLPYIDRMDEIQVADKEVQMLTIMQGGVDYLPKVIHNGELADIAPLKAGEAAGNYRVVLIDGGGGTGHYYFWNYDCPDDKYRELFRNPKFKAAFHHLRDRQRINDTLYYGLGEVTTGFMSPKAIEYNYNDEAREWYRKVRDSFVEYDPEKSMRLLDELGIKDVNGDGFREFPDGSPLALRVDFQATAGKAWLDGHEITIADFAKAGLKMITNAMPVAEFNVLWPNGQGHIRGNWGIGDGPDHLLYPSWVVPDEPNRWSPLGGNYYNARGTEKEDSEKDVSPWQRTPPRWIKSEPELISEPVLQLQALLDTALSEPDAIRRMELVWQMIQIHLDQAMFGSGTSANDPVIYIYGNNLRNAPSREELPTGGFNNPAIVPHPALHFPETFTFV